MTNRPKPGVEQEQFDSLIAEVNEADRLRARQAIGEGVSAAQAQWIEAPIIAEALALELIAFVHGGTSKGEVANHLKALAAELEAQPDLH
jgi:hypothetical protein